MRVWGNEATSLMCCGLGVCAYSNAAYGIDHDDWGW